MDTTTTATVTGIIASLFTLAGVSGVTVVQVQGFVTVIGALITLGALAVAHVSHKMTVASLTAAKPQA